MEAKGKIKMGTWNEAKKNKKWALGMKRKKIKMGTWNEAKNKNGHLE